MTRRSKRFLRVILAALLLTLLLFLVFGVASPVVRAQSIQRQGGTGGASQTQGIIPPATPTPFPPSTATPSPTPQGTVYGGRGPGGSCSNPVGGGPFAVILQQDFHWGSDHLSSRYRHDTVDRLCNDHWAWFDSAGQNVPARQVLSTLHWPPDLFAQPWLDGFVHVGWIPISFPTTPAPVCPDGQNCGVSTNPACFVPLILGQTWNICDPVRAITNAVANALSQGYQRDSAQVTFLWQTPLQPFQDDNAAHLLSFWNSSWAIVLLCLVAVVAWGALRSMVGSVVSWLSYAQVIELLPRLVFALLASLLSKQFFLLLIQANNALSSHFSPTLLQTIIGHPNPGIKLGLVQILFNGLGYALIVEGAVRLAMLYVLFAASPILFFFAALPETQRWAQGTARAAILLVFLQAIQAFVLDVGNRLFGSVLVGSQSTLTLLHILLAGALLYLALATFFVIIRIAFGISGYWIAGFPLLAVTALRGSMRGAQRSLALAGGPHAALPGARTSARPHSFGQGSRVSAGAGNAGTHRQRGRSASAGTRNTGIPRQGNGGSAGVGARHQGGAGGGAISIQSESASSGGRGPILAGPPMPQATTRPLGGAGTNPTGTPSPRSTTRVQSTLPPATGTGRSRVPKRPPTAKQSGIPPQPRSRTRKTRGTP